MPGFSRLAIFLQPSTPNNGLVAKAHLHHPALLPLCSIPIIVQWLSFDYAMTCF